MPDPQEWVKTHRHLQTIGTATCDVSHLLLSADEAREAGNLAVAQALASAARDVLRHRRLARKRGAAAANVKRKRVGK